MSDINKLFNQLPIEHRKIAFIETIQIQINQIRIDQNKAKEAHRKFMRDTNDHLNNCIRARDDAIAELQREYPHLTTKKGATHETSND